MLYKADETGSGKTLIIGKMALPQIYADYHKVKAERDRYYAVVKYFQQEGNPVEQQIVKNLMTY